MKIRKKIFIAMLCCAVGLYSGFGKITAKANSAAPERPDSNSGIVFKQHESVSINSEVLDIKFSKNTADITASYVMHNNSNEELLVETMFLSPIQNGENQEYGITKNGETLEFKQEYFGADEYSEKYSIERWEAILAATRAQTKPLGKGDDFKLYSLTNIGDETKNVQISVEPTESYFARAYQYVSKPSPEKKETFFWFKTSMCILARSDLNIKKVDGVYNIIIEDIPDIYKYLYDYGIGSNKDELPTFAKEQFNQYLLDLDLNLYKRGEPLNMFYAYENADRYVSAVTYFVSFAPQETLNLTVSYKAKLSFGKKRSAKLLYYLTPARYWKSFADITINLTLDEERKFINSSSINFNKIDDLNYIYKSSSLPKKELVIQVSDSKISGISCALNVGIFTRIMLVVLPFLAVVVIALGIRSNNKTKNKKT